MLKKKFFAKALAFAMVMGTVSVYGSGVVAPISIVQAALNKPVIKPDYNSYTAEIETKNSDKYVFLEVLKDQAGTKVSATYCYPVGTSNKTKIDLSFLKATKDQYLRAYGDVLDNGAYVYSDITKIVAQPAKLSIKYDASKGLVDGKTKEAIKIDDGYEFKSLYGSTWADLEADSLKGMEITGNTIVIRKKAVDGTTDPTKGVPASAEVKVKITAIPKAPKAKIDYVKGTISFGKGTEYIKLGNAAIGDSDTWTKNGDTKSLTTAELLTKLGVTDPKAADTTIVVRTAKTDKKAASALSFVTITKKAEIQNTAATGDNPNGGTVDYKATDADKTIKMTWENTTKGISLKAEKAPFQYYDATKKDWKTIAVGKAVEVKLKDKAELKVRVAGKKATKTENGAFASGEVTLTCAILPATIAVSADKTELTAVNATATCTTEIKDGNGETLTGRTGITWTSSNPSVATVDNNGAVKAVANGTTTITAKLGNAEGKIEIKVEIPAAN